MKKFTNAQKVNGELACRGLSEKATEFYMMSYPLTVYEENVDIWSDEDEYIRTDKAYYIRGIVEHDNLTFEDVNDIFEEYFETIMSE